MLFYTGPSSIVDTSWIETGHPQGIVFFFKSYKIYNVVRMFPSFTLFLIEDETSICEQEAQLPTSLTPSAKRFCGELEAQEQRLLLARRMVSPCPRSPHAAADKIALLIGNMNYLHHTQLSAPIADVHELTNLLRQMDFKVVSLLDLNWQEMHSAVTEFLLLLDKGVYGRPFLCLNAEQ